MSVSLLVHQKIWQKQGYFLVFVFYKLMRNIPRDEQV
jgi:hypothetical protein